MSSKLSKGLQVDPIGAHHCNQTSPQIVYELIPISESELIHMSISGGRGKYTQKRKKNKTNKTNKTKQNKKERLKSKKNKYTKRKKQGHMLKKRNK